MEPILRNLFRALGRIFPDCIMLSQAIAFNMFLAFFPVLLLALGVLGATSLFHDALSEIPTRLSVILPPGSTDVVFAYFVRKGEANPWQWISLGLGRHSARRDASNGGLHGRLSSDRGRPA